MTMMLVGRGIAGIGGAGLLTVGLRRFFARVRLSLQLSLIGC